VCGWVFWCLFGCSISTAPPPGPPPPPRLSLAGRLRPGGGRPRARRQMRMMRVAMADGDAAKVKELLPETMSVIDVGWRKGVFHRNTAARYKSRMARQAEAIISGKEA
jgi:small subunit ribosomal protein S20